MTNTEEEFRQKDHQICHQCHTPLNGQYYGGKDEKGQIQAYCDTCKPKSWICMCTEVNRQPPHKVYPPENLSTAVARSIAVGMTRAEAQEYYGLTYEQVVEMLKKENRERE